MNTTKAWKEWTDAMKREASEIDAAADALETITLGMSPLITVGPAGQPHLECTLAALSKEKGNAVARMKDRAERHREIIASAKWLGEPKRSAVLRVVAEPTRDKQIAMARRDGIPRATQRAMQERDMFRSWLGDYDARIDRVVEGARLYAATKA